MNKHTAVCLWDDHVGDSGISPTDEELLDFALAVAEHTRKPYVKLAEGWKERGEALKVDSEDLKNHDPHWAARKALRSQSYLSMADALSKTIEYQKLFSGDIGEPKQFTLGGVLTGRYSIKQVDLTTIP